MPATSLTHALLKKKFGTPDNDLLKGTAADEAFYGNNGNDVILGRAGHDVLSGDAGDDSLHGNEDDDVLEGGAGADTLYGGSGKDTYRFGKGSGRDIVNNADADAPGSNPDTLRLGNGATVSNVKLIRSANDLVVRIRDTEDSVTVRSYFAQEGASAHAVERLLFADGTEWSIADVKAKVIKTTNGDDIIQGYDTLNVLEGKKGNDTMKGGSFIDYLYGNEGDDILDGGAGNDSLYGGRGNDILDGGAGDNTLSGGSGNDTYLINKGTGVTRIIDKNDPGSAETQNILRLGEGLTLDRILFRREKNDLVTEATGSKGKIILENYFSTQGVIRSILFADGSVVTEADLNARFNTGTEGNDYLSGYPTHDAIDGGDGGDFIEGNDGDDTLSGGKGDDTLLGGRGADVLLGGEGDDILLGSVASGNDVLDGGPGNDWMSGGRGKDTYLFGRGSGKDVMIPYNFASSNVIKLGKGITADDIVLTRSYENGSEIFHGLKMDDLTLSIKGTDDSITVIAYFSQPRTFPSTGHVAPAAQSIVFDDGLIWDMADITAHLNTAPVAHHEGTKNSDVLTGGAESDFLRGLNGDDILKGGRGSDVLSGGSGKDVLEGGPGNDALIGGPGQDVYQFGLGDGVDYIDSTFKATNETVPDIIKLGEGMTPANITWTRDSGFSPHDVEFMRDSEMTLVGGVYYDQYRDRLSNLKLSVNGSSERLVIHNYFDSVKTAEIIEFSDGTVMTYSDVQALFTPRPDNGDNVLAGFVTNDVINGLKGNDHIFGGSGNDTLNGSFGDDRLFGGEHHDKMNGGDGDDFLDGEKGDDRLNGGAGNDILLGREQNDTMNGGDGNDYLEGGDGDDLLNGGAGNDTIDDTLGRNILNGGAGDDRLRSYGKDTILNGGAGNDELLGGGGTVFMVDKGFGNDQIYTGSYNSGLNVIRLGEGIARKDVVFHGKIMKIEGTNDSLNLENAVYDIPKITFADGRIWNQNIVINKILQSTITNEDDTVHGYRYGETLMGLDGNDVMYGDSGSDTLNGNEGDDKLYGGYHSDILNGNEGNDELYGEDGSDTMDGGEGDDTLYGEEGVDTLIGGGGSDILFGAGSTVIPWHIGRDVFTYLSLTDSAKGAKDVIMDFTRGMDRIDLSELGFIGKMSEFSLSQSAGYTHLDHLTKDFGITLKGNITLTEDSFEW